MGIDCMGGGGGGQGGECVAIQLVLTGGVRNIMSGIRNITSSVQS